MNRQEAIDILSTHYEPDDQRLEQALDMAIEALKAPHWIPCSERLPELNESGSSEMVLLCWSDGQVTVGAYAGNRTFCGQAWPKAKDARVIVAAWMPLPDPYKADLRGEE